MADLIPSFKAYFESFDGKKHTLEEIQPQIDEIFATDVVIVTATGDIKHEQWIESVKGFLETGSKCEVIEMKPHPKGIDYTCKLTTPPDMEVVSSSIAIVENGKIVRVEPRDDEAMKKIFGEPK